MKPSFGFLRILVVATAILFTASCTITIRDRSGAVTVYVSASGSDANTGLSASSPLLTLQTAVNLAKASNATTLYISGNFLLTNTNSVYSCGLLLSGVTNLTISGGWDSLFNFQSGESLLDGDAVADHVVFVRNSTGLSFSKLVVTGGWNGAKNGGGFFLTNCNNSSFDCRVTNNFSLEGGGYYLIRSDSNVIGGTISSNAANNYGGGIRLTNSWTNRITALVSSNETMGSSSYGGGISLIYSDYTILEGTITLNYSDGDSGGIDLVNSQNSTISSTISYNEADEDGGGVYLYQATNNTFTSSCVIRYNRCDANDTSSYFGGGLYGTSSAGNTIQTSATSPNYNGSGTGTIDNLYGSY